MPDSSLDKRIAVVNSSADTMDMLRVVLERNGFRNVVTIRMPDINTWELEAPTVLSRHDPAVVVYDISLPYVRHWAVLKDLLGTESMRGRKVVVTTTNKSLLEVVVGQTDAFEIMGKPYDLDQVVRAVKAALGGE